MFDFKEEIWRLEEASRAIAEKSKDVQDIEAMAAIQHIQQAIHSAYVNLRKLNGY